MWMRPASGTEEERPRQGAPVPAAAPEGVLPAARWAELAATFERWPRVLERALAAPPVSAGELFTTLLNAAEARQTGVPAGFVFFLGARPLDEPDAYLPEAADGSLEGYVERVLETTGGEDFTLLLADPHLHGEALWTAARRFARSAWRHLGMPCGGVDTGLFLGRYRRTPFGVHRGQMSVLTFPTVGGKRFRLWERTYGERHRGLQDSLDYGAHLEASFGLEAAPGDILYWPADFWHIAEGGEDFTAAWNLGLWWDRPAPAQVLLQLGELLAAGDDGAEGERWEVEAPVGGAPPALPAHLGRTIEQVRREASAGGLERAVVGEWLRLLSADGFRQVPPPLHRRQAEVREGDLLEPVPGSRLLWSAAGHGVLLAANGHRIALPPAAVSEAALRRVAAGEPVAVDELRAAVDPATRLALPELLVAWRVLRRRPPAGPEVSR